MTEANQTPLPLDGESSESPNIAAEPLVTPAKKTPRRKVASRPKASTAAVAEGAGSETAAVELPAKPRRAPRRKAASLKEPAGESGANAASVQNSPKLSASAPAAQAEIMTPQALIESPDPQSRVETQVITPKVMRELEERTAVNFGTDGNISQPSSATPQTQAVPQIPPVLKVPLGMNPSASGGEGSVSQSTSSPTPAPDAPSRQVVDPRPAAEPRQVPEQETTIGPTAPAPMPPEVPAIAAPTAPENTSVGAFQREDRRQQPQQQYQQNPPQNQQRHGNQQHPQNQQRFGRDDRRQGRDDHRQNRFDRQNPPQGDNQPRGEDRQSRFDGQNPQRGDNQPRGDDRQNRFDRQNPSQGDGQPRGDGQSRGDGQYQPSQQGGGGDTLVSRPTEVQYAEGIIEVSGKGFGFLREPKRNFVQTPADIFVTPEVCRKYNLRDGQWIKGEIRRSSRGPQMFRLTALNGEDPEKFRNLPNFDELTTINPRKRIKLETVPERYTTRVMDLMTPIGKGQRGLLVAPPRTGKTTLLQHIAESVVINHPEMKLIILLVDERPEEVTEIRRAVPQAEIMASSNDSDLKSHTRIAQLAMERCKRMVEAGQHVFMLLDSITRMARAFNNTMSGGRASQSGGLAVGALEIPRKIFAAARNTEEAGSLTIMATALIETNSKMDDAIFQEFKGTGNMELVLDRKISDQRIYPAVDIFLSGTRREELLLQPWELDKINVIRRGLAGHKPIEAIERLLSFLKKFPTNSQMLASLPG